MLNDLLLLSGNDIPFPLAQVNIHQPTLQEIAYIGEETFFIGCELLNFSKDNLTSEDKAHLNNQSNFDIIMSIMKNKSDLKSQKNVKSALLVLTLMFPNYQIQIKTDCIALIEENFSSQLDNNNYSEFQNILKAIFCLTQRDKENYNPKGRMAQKIADKIKKGKQKVAAAKGQDKKEKIAIFSRYLSILAVGQQKNLNELMQYTVYQLSDEFQRYQLKINYDIYLQAKMAGAKDLKDVDNWMDDMYSEDFTSKHNK